MKTKHSRLPQCIIAAIIVSTLTFVPRLSAQVTVGSDIAPNKATLLDLKMQQLSASVTAVTDEANVTSTSGGLLLPRVKLINISTLQPFIATDDPDYTAEFKLRHAGLLVYNITSNGTLEPGIYIWTGIQWATYTTTVSPSSITEQPKPFTFYEKGSETPVALKFKVAGSGTWSYEWYRITGSNLHVRVGTKIDASNAGNNGYGSGYDTDSFTPKVCIGTTRNANNCNFYRYYCIAKSTSGAVFTSDIAEVAVGCGAKNNQGEWVSFMCYNLGAKHDISISEQINYKISHSRNMTSGLHTYVAGEENVYGATFQWGRIPDGHEKRNSLTQYYGGIQKTDIVSGYKCSAADYREHPWLQVGKSSTWYGKFITTIETTSYNWNPHYNTLTYADILWQSGRDVRNDPCSHYKVDSTYVEFWHDGTADSDPGNGVCQDAGTAWRLPTSDEWGSIYKSGSLSGTSAAATANSWSWDDGGMTTSGENYNFTRPGGFQIRPDNQTTTLFLPAGGHRHCSLGILNYQGTDGVYWSSTVTSTFAHDLLINKNSVQPGYSDNRGYGLAVRCIKNI
jgi:uncharacterized protein (TIGR02145 family)